MKVKKLINFLNNYDQDSRLGLVILDVDKHRVFSVGQLVMTNDSEPDPLLIMTLQPEGSYEDHEELFDFWQVIKCPE